MSVLKTGSLYERFGRHSFGIHDEKGNMGVAMTKECFVSSIDALKCAMAIPFKPDDHANSLSMTGKIMLIEMIERINELLGGALDSDHTYVATRDRILRQAPVMSELAQVEDLPIQPIQPYVVTNIEGINEPALYMSIQDAVMLSNTIAYVLEYGERNPLPHHYLRDSNAVWSSLFTLLTHMKEGITGEQGLVAGMTIRAFQSTYDDMYAQYIASLTSLVSVSNDRQNMDDHDAVNNNVFRHDPESDSFDESHDQLLVATENAPTEVLDTQKDATKKNDIIQELVSHTLDDVVAKDEGVSADDDTTSAWDALLKDDKAESHAEAKKNPDDSESQSPENQVSIELGKTLASNVVPMPSATEASKKTNANSELQSAWG